MNEQSPLPSLDGLKTQARRLRASLAENGTQIAHSKSLELLAHQYGYADWNTLHAAVGNQPPACPVAVGDRVRGRYLGQPFDGTVLGVQAHTASDRYRVTMDFDAPVDVVTFESFSAYRKRVSCTIDSTGRTVEATSDGTPHMVLSLHSRAQ